MATNLRLRPDAAQAVREEARRTGRSQQDVIREAVDRHLGLSPASEERTELEVMIASGVARRPRTAYREATERVRLPSGTTTDELLDRRERL